MKATREFFNRLTRTELLAWYIFRDVDHSRPAELDPPFFTRAIENFEQLSHGQVIDLLFADGFDVSDTIDI